LNDENLSITIYGKNIGIDIPFDLGFAWKVKDLDVPSNKTVDSILINNTEYKLDGTYDLTFKDIKKYATTFYSTNQTTSNGSIIYDYLVVEVPMPFYKMFDRNGMGLRSKENFLRIDWDENLNYAVKMFGNGNQEDFYVALLINAGSFNPGQEKQTTLYWVDALTDNLRAYYNFDESSGTNLPDVVGSTYNGTLNNMGDEDWVSGILGNALNFDDSDDFVDGDMENVISDYGTASFSMWVDMGTNGAILSTDLPAKNDDLAFGEDAGKFYVQRADEDTNQYYTIYTNDAYDSGTFHHFVGVLNSSGMFLFVDGVVQNDHNSFYEASTNQVGWKFSKPNLWGGTVDEVGIWDRSLTLSEIQELYNSGVGLTYPFVEADETPPTYSNAQTNTTIAGATILFSILYDDDTALEPDGDWVFSTNNTGTWVNESVVDFTETPEWANVTKTLNDTADTVIGYRWYANDSAGNNNNTPIYTLTTVDITPPYFTDIPEDDTITYGIDWDGVDFDATDVIEFDTYSINDSRFTINSTGFLDDITILGADSYFLNVTINDTSGNVNSTLYTLTIDKATPTGSLTNTDTWTEPYLEEVEIGLSETNIGDGDLTYIVYRDGVSKGIGETIILGVGTYDYVLNTTGGANYSAVADMDSKTLTVTKITPTGSLTSNLGWEIDEGDEVEIGLSETNIGDGDVTYIIYRDGVAKATGETWSPTLGTYDYVLNTTGGANYSLNASIDTQTLIVNDVTLPLISITYPTAITYSENVSILNYTYTETNPDSCWYSVDDGATNLSVVSMGTNFTNVISIGGSNTWRVYCNDTSNNNVSDSITFFVNKLWYNEGYPFTNKSFRISEFINVSGKNFTLAGQQYRFLGADSYYLSDYATNLTYDDDGNKITNSKQYVLEILNEAQYLNINVIRTWAGTFGSDDSHWEIDQIGGHYNLFVNGDPGNYNETTFAALDWVIYEASKRDIRLQLVLINNWNDYGGMRWWVSKSSTADQTHKDVDDDIYPDFEWSEYKDQFYTDSECIHEFQDYVNYTLNRNNTYSGIKYKDDPAIFAWLLVNEPRAKSDGTGRDKIKNWTTNMTTFIKSIDSNHLVGLGIEGWGVEETWGEGTDMIADHETTGVDFATYALHPDQWQYFAERSEHDGGGLVTEGTGTNTYVDWWTVDNDLSYNNKYHLDDTYYIPDLGRYGYDNWVAQNVKWANELDMPVLLQEAGYLTVHEDAIKDRFYQQMINTFYSEGGDGLLFWTLNHDNYYYSTNVNGTMDDGYGFYLSDDEFLKNKSQSIIDAINFTKYDNSGGSWITELNPYKYDFVFNIGFASDTAIDNCTLYLNVSDGTWSNYYADQSNSTPIVYNEDYTFTKQFDSDDEEFYWYIACYGDSTFINSTIGYAQIKSATPVINLVSPINNTLHGDTINFVYNITNTIEISFCELYIDDNLNKTDYTVLLDINQSFLVSGLSNGNHNWSVKCTDIDSNEGFSETRNFDVDSTPPYFTDIPENTTINYTQGFGVDFDAEDETGFDSYAINWTTLFQINQSGWLENSTANIGAGTYLINVIINDTLNNLNSTLYKVTVDKATPIGTLTNTDTWIEPYLESVTIGLSETNIGDGDVTYKVYRNGVDKGNGETVTLGVGTYNYVLNTTGGVNWTANASMDTKTLTIEKIASQTSLTFSVASPQTYGTVITPTCSVITGEGSAVLKMDGNVITSGNPLTLGVDTYSFNCSLDATQNYTASSNSSDYTINKATPSGSLTGTSPINYRTQGDVEGTEANTGDGGCVYKLYRESIEVSNPDDSILGVGVWNYVYNTTGCTNYSSSASLDTFILTINKADPSPNMDIDGTTPIIYPTFSDFSKSETNIGDGGCSYSMDRSNKIYGVDTWTFKYSTSGCANYTSGDVTKNLVVNQNTTYVLTITGTTPIGYGTITDVVVGGCPVELSCSLDKANAIYGVGTETFNYSTPGNTNYSSKYITKDIVINKGTLVATITNSRENTFEYDGTPTNIGISESNTGDGDVVYRLWKDGLNVGTSDAEKDLGVYNYKLNSTGGINYSSSASLDTLTLTIRSKYPDLVKRITQVLQALIVLSSFIIVFFMVKSFYEEERTLGEVIRVSLYVGLGTFILIMLMPIMVSYIAKLIV